MTARKKTSSAAVRAVGADRRARAVVAVRAQRPRWERASSPHHQVPPAVVPAVAAAQAAQAVREAVAAAPQWGAVREARVPRPQTHDQEQSAR